jgi:hypothetical protein
MVYAEKSVSSSPSAINCSIHKALYGKPRCTCTCVYMLVAARSKALVCGRSLAGVAGSESRRGHRYLSVTSFVCCQEEVSATS